MPGTEKKEPVSESREMREEIRKTENEIAESLKTIRERLSPEHLKGKALQKVICAAIVGIERTEHFIRKYPVPTIVAGIMLGWLALRKRQSACRRRSVS